MDKESIDGLRSDIAFVDEKLGAIKSSLDWIIEIVGWSALICIALLGLILWRVW